MKLDALVVLGAKVDERGAPGGALRRRLARALEAYRAGLAPFVLCSGGKEWPGGVEAQVMWRYVVDRGVPAERVVMEAASRTTLENAAFCSQLAELMNWKRLGIVTCSWHMPRALRNFDRYGVMTEPVPARNPERTMAERTVASASEMVSSVLDPARFVVRRWI